MRRNFLSDVVCFMSAYTKLLAAKDDHPATPKLSRIPTAPLRDKKMPKNPTMSMGNNAYPTVLMIL